MNNYQIETTQNIDINQDIADLGSRIGASALDFGFMYTYIYVITILIGLSNVNSPSEGMIVALIIAFIPIVFYHLIFEYFMNGQTPGKKILKIQVVKTNGASAGFIEYLLRWLFRFIDTSFMGIVGIIVFLVNGKGQRLGDIVAGTTVVKLASTHKSNHVFINIDDDYIPTFPHVTLFTDEDIAKIKELYIKARRRKDWDLLAKLREKIKEKLKIETEMSDIEFVKTIVKDYYYYYYNDDETSFLE